MRLSKILESIIAPAALCVTVVCSVIGNSHVDLDGRGNDWCQNHTAVAKGWAAEISNDLYQEC